MNDEKNIQMILGRITFPHSCNLITNCVLGLGECGAGWRKGREERQRLRRCRDKWRKIKKDKKKMEEQDCFDNTTRSVVKRVD